MTQKDCGQTLSDLTGDVEERTLDVREFLGALISNNSIGYPQDRIAREWTFDYYLSDARFRLQYIADRPPLVIEPSDLNREAGSAKEDWEIAQRALEKAIRGFAALTTPPAAAGQADESE